MAQNLHFKIDSQSLKPEPIRLTLEAPATVAATLEPHLAEAPNQYMYNIATSNWGEEEAGLVALAEQADETVIYALLGAASTNLISGNSPQGLLAVHTIIKRALDHAMAAGEIWSPLLNFLAVGRKDNRYYYNNNSSSYWSSATLDQIKLAHPHLEILPKPTTWLLGAARWVARTPVNTILARIETQHPAPWHPVLAAHGTPITAELVDFLLPVQKSMLTLISRPLTEEDYIVILRRTLHRLATEDQNSNRSRHPNMAPLLPILHRDPGSNHLDNEREIFARVMAQLGHLPEAIRSDLDQAAQIADKHAGKPVMSGAQLLRATDQTVPGSEFIPLLENSTGTSLAPLTGHRDFITLAKDQYYEKLLHRPTTSYYSVQSLQSLLMRERTIDSRVLMDIAAQALKPGHNNSRDSNQIIDVIKHPSATADIWRRIAEECEMTPVRIALAGHPKARQVPEIRSILMRMRIADIVSPLLKDASPDECLVLWQKLVVADPSLALDMLEQGLLPPGFSVPQITIAPILKSGQKELIIRAMRLSKFLTGGEMSAKDLKKAKTAKIRGSAR